MVAWVAVALTFLLLAILLFAFNWIWSAIPPLRDLWPAPRAAGPDHTIPSYRQRIQAIPKLRRFRKSPFGFVSRRRAPFVARRAVNLHGCALPHFAPLLRRPAGPFRSVRIPGS